MRNAIVRFLDSASSESGSVDGPHPVRFETRLLILQQSEVTGAAHGVMPNPLERAHPENDLVGADVVLLDLAEAHDVDRILAAVNPALDDRPMLSAHDRADELASHFAVLHLDADIAGFHRRAGGGRDQ